MALSRVLSRIVLALTAPLALAQVAITPTSLTLASDQTFEVLEVHNDSDSAKTFQITLKKWTQEDGKDILVKSQDLLFSPPIFLVPANGVQMVRLARKSAGDSQLESAYRLEVTQAPALFSKSKSSGSGVTMLITFNLPVFLLPDNVEPQKYEWSVANNKSELSVTLNNLSNTHIRLDTLEVKDANNQSVLKDQRFFNVLAKGQMRFVTKNQGKGPAYRILTTLNGQTKEFHVQAKTPTP